MTDPRRYAAATQRNRGPILEILRRVWTESGRVLEVASDTGEHAIAFASELPHLQWQPTDPDPTARASIDGWRHETRLANVLPAIDLDVRRGPWPSGPFDGVFCANMIHIAPWECTAALMRGAAGVLTVTRRLVLYGPFAVDGGHTAPSNAAFDQDLRARDPSWGVRDLAEVLATAAQAGLREVERIAMPANNLTVVLERVSAPPAVVT